MLISGWYNILGESPSNLPPFLCFSANCHHHSSPAYIPSIPLWHLTHKRRNVTNTHSNTHSKIERKCTLLSHTYPSITHYFFLTTDRSFHKDVNECGKLTYISTSLCLCVCVCVCLLSRLRTEQAKSILPDLSPLSY